MTRVQDRPGARVQNYRNSQPRSVKLVGVGETARTLAEDVAAEMGSRVILGPAPSAAEPLDASVDGVRPGALVLVLHALESTADLPPVVERTAATLSVVLIEPKGTTPGAKVQSTADRVRAVADMFASTSDPDFVRELVANLSS